MVQLGLMDDFKCPVLQWDGANLHTKEPSTLLGKYDLTKREMREVVMQNVAPASTLEATDRMVRILDSTYAKAHINQVSDNAIDLDAELKLFYLAFSRILRTCLMVL